MTSIKDPRRQRLGAIAKAKGKHFEERLDQAFTYYRDRGYAIIEKTPEPMRPTKNLGNGKFIAFFEKKAQPDYKGVIKGGRAVMFEAKFTSKERMEQDRVERGQGEYLGPPSSPRGSVLCGGGILHQRGLPDALGRLESYEAEVGPEICH